MIVAIKREKNEKNLIGICLIMMLFFIGILSSCGDTACNHKEEIILGEAATCIKEGLSEGKKCSLCNELLVVQKELEALGHKEIVEEAVAATCNKTGKTENKSEADLIYVYVSVHTYIYYTYIHKDM